jgi:CubicO group peptidase (beta-lactamase class C family)
MRSRCLLVVLALLVATAAAAAELPIVKPADAGLSAERLDRLSQFFKDRVAKGEPPGVVALVSRGGKVGYLEGFGLRDPETKAPIAKDSIFRMYSMTKPITSVAVMMLWEEGKFRLGDPVGQYLPALRDQKVLVESVDGSGNRKQALVAPERPMTIQDLLRHTSGLTYGAGNSAQEKELVAAGLGIDVTSKSPLNSLTNAQVVERLGKTPLMFHPGTAWVYGRSTDVLGHLVEVVSGTDLDRFFEERIFRPLGMTDTHFNLGPDKLGRAVQPGPEGPSRAVADLVDLRQSRKFYGGGEALVSTAADYWRFCQMLLNGGTLDGQRILSRKTVEYMTADHVGSLAGGPMFAPGPGYGFGLGFATRTATGMSAIPGSVGEYNWGGAAGTAFWIDPKEQLVAIMLIQSPGQRIPMRFGFRSLVYQSLD